jgi:ubiquinone/menaquinone biosynthesis C-methylase UbiE
MRGMPDTKTASRDWFDRRARSYEGGFTSRWRDPVQRASLESLELTAADLLLDLGCGTGWASRTAAGKFGEVIGVDMSSKMLDQARSLSEGIDRVRYAAADAEALPFSDGRFTAVLCTNSFHHYPNPRGAIGEMRRVLSPGGRLVIGDACSDLLTARIADSALRRFEPGHVRLYRALELAALVQEAGLRPVKIKRLTRGAHALVHGVRA